VLPVASVGICLFLISQLPRDTFVIFAVWLAAAALIYVTYSNRSSSLAKIDDSL
jgi:APA family basic amino acid/polyamine antiporter